MQPPSGPDRPGTILLADDDDDSIRVSRAILENHGYRVITACDGRECIELARQEVPDLVVMDLWMPALDGLEATRVLKADPALAHIIVIAVSAYVIDGAQERAAEAGCSVFIAKPVEPMALVAEVRRCLG